MSTETPRPQMKALSIRQPWAWLIIRPDLVTAAERTAAYARGEIKDIENRSWWTNYRGPLLVHASKTIEYDAVEYIESEYGIKIPAKLQTGGIIGAVDPLDCLKWSSNRWHQRGFFGFVLKNSRPLTFQSWPGRQGLFNFDGQLAEAHEQCP